jgi:hypothetical protein
MSALALLAVVAIMVSADGAGNPDVYPDQPCMQEVYLLDPGNSQSLNCTANDVRLGSVTNLISTGCAYLGDTVTFTATYEVLLTAQARHDIGVYFATDGDGNSDGAYTGICSIVTLPYGPSPYPYTDLDGTNDSDPPGTQDQCGDIDDDPNPIVITATLSAVCLDDDGDLQMDLPYCTSWRQPGANDFCLTGTQAYPGTPSKCLCDPGFEVPIPVPGRIIVEKETLDWTGDLFPHPQVFGFTLSEGGGGSTIESFGLSSLNNPTHTIDVLSDTYTLVEDFIAFPNWAFVGANCVSDQGNADQDPMAGDIVLNAGETLWCKFTNQADRELAVTLASMSVSGQFNVLIVLAVGLIAVAAASGGLLWRRARVRQG